MLPSSLSSSYRRPAFIRHSEERFSRRRISSMLPRRDHYDEREMAPAPQSQPRRGGTIEPSPKRLGNGIRKLPSSPGATRAVKPVRMHPPRHKISPCVYLHAIKPPCYHASLSHQHTSKWPPGGSPPNQCPSPSLKPSRSQLIQF
jgi:hypothetical protein